jgi:NAD(P)-dependent dehydrogenase (short-subunit alcohol dehydrogenase family)
MRDRVAIVTGAGRGIGRAVALALASDGYRVALVARSAGELDGVAREISAELDVARVRYFPGDVADAGLAPRIVREVIGAWGGIDVLFNNAGINPRGSLDLSVDAFAETLAVNVIGAFSFAKAVVPVFKEQGSGYLFNVSSVCGKHGFAGTGGYTASKFALSGLSECLYRELLPLGVSVTALCPNWVDTAMASHSHVASGDRIQTDDIVKTVRYLLSLGHGATVREIVVDCRFDPL